MLQNLQDFAKFQKFQLDNLVDFEKCFKTRIYLQRSVPIQPKKSEDLPKCCPIAQLPHGSPGAPSSGWPGAGPGTCRRSWAASRTGVRGPTTGVRGQTRSGDLAKLLQNRLV